MHTLVKTQESGRYTFQETGGKYCKSLKVQLWNDDVSKSQRRMPGIQEAKFSVGHTLESAGRYVFLQAATHGKMKAFQ